MTMKITTVKAIKTLTKMMTVAMKITLNKLTKMMTITTTTACMENNDNNDPQHSHPKCIFFCPQVINISSIFHSQHEQRQENVQLTLHSLCRKTVGNINGDEGLSVIGRRIYSIDHFHNDNRGEQKNCK